MKIAQRTQQPWVERNTKSHRWKIHKRKKKICFEFQTMWGYFFVLLKLENKSLMLRLFLLLLFEFLILIMKTWSAILNVFHNNKPRTKSMEKEKQIHLIGGDFLSDRREPRGRTMGRRICRNLFISLLSHQSVCAFGLMNSRRLVK